MLRSRGRIAIRSLFVRQGDGFVFVANCNNSVGRYSLIGALVYFAKIIPWEFPEFSVDSCFDGLCKMERELQENRFIEGTEHRFVIAARKH